VDRHVRAGILFAALAAVLFGSSYVATAFALRSFTPLAIAAWRGIIAALTVAVVARAGLLATRPRGRLDGPRLVRLAVLGLLGGPAFIVSLNVAVSQTGATISSFVAGLYAVLGAILAPALLGERLRPAAVAGFAAALAGTALLAELDPAGAPIAGFGAGLAAAAAYALFLVLGRRWSAPWDLPVGAVVLAQLLWSGPGILVVELLREPAAIAPAAPRPDALLALAWLAIPVGVAAQLLVVASVRRLDARRSSAFLLLNPPSAALLAWLLLGESLTATQLAGGLLVLLGIAVASGAVEAGASTARRGGRRGEDEAGAPVTRR